MMLMMMLMMMIVKIALSRKSVRSMHAGGRLLPSCNQDDELEQKMAITTYDDDDDDDDYDDDDDDNGNDDDLGQRFSLSRRLGSRSCLSLRAHPAHLPAPKNIQLVFSHFVFC